MIVPGVGLGFALWSAATVIGVSSAANSLGSSVSFLPQKLASLDASFAMPLPGNIKPAGKMERPDHWRSVVLQSGKAGRAVAQAGPGMLPEIVATSGEHVDRIAMQASLSPQALADLFSHPTTVATGPSPDVPLKERFYEQAKTIQANPAAERFGPKVAETERSSRLALALSGTDHVELAAFTPSISPLIARPAGVFVAPQEILEASLETDMPLVEGFPDAAPLPTNRPELAEAKRAAAPSVAVAKPAEPPRVEKPKLAEAPVRGNPPEAKSRSRSSGTELAYAKPDNPVSDLGQAFKNLFSAKPRRNGGVAIYDISAQTVYMPDGERLEAHSGMGVMVDDIRYIRTKNRGPTPPNTYNLVMRESRFHGVEAIRLIPVDGHNKFGRDGLLAHTYMLRGGRAESNGCVVFRNYDRFLRAFKQGRIKQLVVVPGTGRARTRLASYGRGA